MIKDKEEMIKGIGLILMFLLGWVASDLFNSIKCGDCDYRQKGLERRVEQMEPYKNRYDMMREGRKHYRKPLQQIGENVV
tara:strand:- start:306 stop:545 length:240 start_codon:yes stop_codon:yes gene_type:complete